MRAHQTAKDEIRERPAWRGQNQSGLTAATDRSPMARNGCVVLIIAQPKPMVPWTR